MLQPKSYNSNELITAYYLGGLGGENHPIPIVLRGGKVVHTPPIGEAFSRKFTPAEYKNLEMQCGYHDERGRFITTVTQVKSKAELAKKGKKATKAIEPTTQANLSDEQLIAELKARGIDIVLVNNPATVTGKENTGRKRPANKKEVKENA